MAKFIVEQLKVSTLWIRRSKIFANIKKHIDYKQNTIYKIFGSIFLMCIIYLQKKNFYMSKQIEIQKYDDIMNRTLMSALKYINWWLNNLRGGNMLISAKEIDEAVDFATAYAKKLVTLSPSIAESSKFWCKEFFAQFLRYDLNGLKANLQEVMPKYYRMKIDINDRLSNNLKRLSGI